MLDRQTPLSSLNKEEAEVLESGIGAEPEGPAFGVWVQLPLGVSRRICLVKSSLLGACQPFHWEEGLVVLGFWCLEEVERKGKKRWEDAVEISGRMEGDFTVLTVTECGANLMRTLQWQA